MILFHCPFRVARVYDCGVGPRGGPLLHYRSRQPRRSPARQTVGALRQSRRLFSFPAALLCNARVERKCLMGRMNWSRIATRDRMRRHGVEDIKGKMPLVSEPPKQPLSEPPKQPCRKLSNGELRQRTAAAFLAWRAGQTSKNK